MGNNNLRCGDQMVGAFCRKKNPKTEEMTNQRNYRGVEGASEKWYSQSVLAIWTQVAQGTPPRGGGVSGGN